MNEPMVFRPRFPPAIVIAVALALLVAGCSKPKPLATTMMWVLGGSEPSFDPQGPPDARRWALERLLNHGLVTEDSSGAIVAAAAESITVSADSLTWTFQLRDSLEFTDGAPCTSEHFRQALLAGLVRRDHGTAAWRLAAVRGVDAMRPAKPLPPLGIAAADARTLVVTLARRDPLFLRKLAVPGMEAWSHRGDSTWLGRAGLGPYRVIQHDPARRLRLLHARGGNVAGDRVAPDTITIRFGLPAGRARALLREGEADLVWPLPVGLLDENLPATYRAASRPARPRRQMQLVMRADLPPTSKLPARQTLAHGINRDDIARLLGPGADARTTWITGASSAEFPALDGDEIAQWMERGNLGRSFHVDMAYRGDGPAAAIARTLQGEWSGYSIYVEPRPLRGDRFVVEALAGRMHLVLVESQPLIDHPAAELAQLVMPLRGPAVGNVRTGWRTREFDPWILPPLGAPLGADQVERRLEEELIVLPLAELQWVWVERAQGVGFSAHPHYGPDCLVAAPAIAKVP